MKLLALCFVFALSVLIVACGGSGGNSGGGTTAPSSPFNGTWSANNPVTAGAVDTMTLTASGIAITGSETTRSSQGSVTGSISGTVINDHAGIIVTYSSGSSFEAQLALSGGGISMTFTSAKGVAETESFIAGTTPPPVQSAEAFCAALPSAGFGHYFFCGTNQANLQYLTFPDGSLGFCDSADASSGSLGLVGYAVITFNGHFFPVETQSQASADLKNCPTQASCEGYIMCTRQ